MTAAIPACIVTGRIAGDSDACHDCDPCSAAHVVPDAVKRLLAEKDEWRQKYGVAMGAVDELRTAVRWALGETPDAEGHWFGELQEDERRMPYWWRKHLRKIAGMGDLVYDKERRTIVNGDEQKPAT